MELVRAVGKEDERRRNRPTGDGVVGENLYVCDVSVFPYIPTANPSLTLGALAMRLADHLRAAL